jgi:hypothetical protein
MPQTRNSYTRWRDGQADLRMKNPTEADLHRAMEHIVFEFLHFQKYGRLIHLAITGRNTVPDPLLFQAVGYSYLIHFRAVLEFFYSKGPRRR